MSKQQFVRGYIVKYFPFGTERHSQLFNSRNEARANLENYGDNYNKNSKRKAKIVKWLTQRTIYTEEEKKERERLNHEANKLFQNLLVEHFKLERRIKK